MAPGYLKGTLSSFSGGLIVVSGSAGKSTTTKMLVAVLRAHGLDVFTNPSTANISQGLTAALLAKANLNGRVKADIAVLEMDEGHGALVLQGVSVNVAVLTNVMVDQVDRFHDSELVAGMLGRIAARAKRGVVINADDAYLERIASQMGNIPVHRFGVSADILSANKRGLGYSDTSAERLAPGSGVRVLSVQGTAVQLDDFGNQVAVRVPARGVHYAVDAAAAYAAAKVVMGARFSADVTARALSAIPAVFGRGERVSVRGQEVDFVLIQNPASTQLNIDSIPEETTDVLFAIGTDVRDPSYFWSADISSLGSVLIASGAKAWEAALMLAYSGVRVDRVEPDLSKAIDDFLAAPPPKSGTKTIVFTADSMRKTRHHLGLTEAG